MTTARSRRQPKGEKRYSAATVIRSQKRVLNLALNTIGRMSKRQLLTLRVCGDGGLITLNELSEHIVAAIHLKVRQDGTVAVIARKTAQENNG